MVAPAASVPPAADKVTHVCTFDAVQFIEAVPVFVTVYDWLDGVNGPPSRPRGGQAPGGRHRHRAGHGAALTVRLTARVVFPVPLVVLVKVTVSL